MKSLVKPKPIIFMEKKNCKYLEGFLFLIKSVIVISGNSSQIITPLIESLLVINNFIQLKSDPSDGDSTISNAYRFRSRNHRIEILLLFERNKNSKFLNFTIILVINWIYQLFGCLIKFHKKISFQNQIKTKTKF